MCITYRDAEHARISHDLPGGHMLPLPVSLDFPQLRHIPWRLVKRGFSLPRSAAVKAGQEEGEAQEREGPRCRGRDVEPGFQSVAEC